MPAAAPTYDLVMLLDPEAEDDARAKLVSDARAAIEAQGELVRHDDWGSRSLTYPIERQAAAEYHLLQFHVGAPELLEELNRSLRIADGVMRFRIIKLRPGVSEAPDMRSSGAGASAPAAGASAEEDVPAEEPARSGARAQADASGSEEAPSAGAPQPEEHGAEDEPGAGAHEQAADAGEAAAASKSIAGG